MKYALEIGELLLGKCCVIEEINTGEKHSIRRITTQSREEAESIKREWMIKNYRSPGLYQVLA